MPPDANAILFQMQQAAIGIELFTAGKSLSDFEADLMMRMAVERQFEIIGEALSRLRKSSPATAELISESRGIISFRNVLIHGYDVVDNQVTWRIIQEKLPVLRREVDAILKGDPRE